MAKYDINEFVNPAVLTDLTKLRDSIQGSTQDLMKFLEAQKKLKEESDKTTASNGEAGRKMTEYSALVNKAAENHNKLVQKAKA